MARKLGCCLAATIAAVLTFCGAAGAVTLGTVAQPSGSTPDKCLAGAVVAEIQSDPATPYAAPSPGGEITQWSTNTTGDTAGAAITLVVLRSAGGGSYTVVATDIETLPTPLPAGGVATFLPPTPIAVSGGDFVGLYSSTTGSGDPVCYWIGGSTPSDATAARFDDASAPAAGQSLTVTVTGTAIQPNLAVTLTQSEDVGVSTAAGPANAAAGRPAVLSSMVTNAGPGDNPITFVDHVPAGLTISAALAAQGTCSTTGQTVTCTIDGVSAGQSAPVVVIVTPAAAGSYANTVSVSTPVQDPNSANNTASATLVASAPAPTPMCVVPRLKNVSSKLAGTVLKDLGCKVKTTKAHSKSVRKGNVIKTTPGAGTHPFGTTVRVEVSTGSSQKKHRTGH
jgi:Domain of unknown function DUF11/PASTA domain